MRNTIILTIITIIMTTACSTQKEENVKNPFLGEWQTPHQTPPFNLITNDDYLPAVKAGIDEGRKEIATIVENKDNPTFENTILALENAGQLLSRVTGVFFNLLSAETNDTLQNIAKEVSPILTEYHNDISLNAELFAKVKMVYDQRASLNLTGEQNMLLEESYLGFVRSGANLSGEAKERYRTISKELSSLTLQFGDNVLKETNNYQMVITDEKELAGLTPDVIEAAAMKAKEKETEGWIFDLTFPSYSAFMKYAQNREKRKELYMAYNTKAVKGDDLDNRENVRKIVNLRLEKAKLLGYDSYAKFVLENRMAENPTKVYALLDELYDASFPAAKKEKAEMEAFAREMGDTIEELMPWDLSYYAEKLKTAKYDINDEMTRPYFELNKVIAGVFGLATDLYGITFKENRDIPVYNKEVIPYEVYDEDGTFISVFYTDFHPRASKRGGAWMTEFRGQKIVNGVDERPQVSIVMNFTKPTETKPALLSFGEVETFLHEFGHALHGMLTKCHYESLSGTNVYRDFVELPSQMLENWGVEKAFLDKFAAHYETGEKIPEALVKKIKTAQNFNAGYASLRQLSFGLLDMAWHSLETPYTGDIAAFEKDAWAKAQLFPNIEGTLMSSSFSHIFAGGYAAGYYGYKWAEVLDADAFAAFKENGIFNKATAKKFRENILEKGATEKPMTLYINFRGHEPSIEALLERSGLRKN